MNFLDELKRRTVFRVALVYGATAFVVLQVADLLADGLNLPAWLFPTVTVLLVLGFPVTLVLAAGWTAARAACSACRPTAARRRWRSPPNRQDGRRYSTACVACCDLDR